MSTSKTFDYDKLSPRQFCEVIFMYIVAKADARRSNRRSVVPGTLGKIQAKTQFPPNERAFYNLIRSQESFINSQVLLLSSGSSDYETVRRETEGLTSRLYGSSADVVVVKPLETKHAVMPAPKARRMSGTVRPLAPGQLEAEFCGVKFIIKSTNEVKLFAQTVAELKHLEVR